MRRIRERIPMSMPARIAVVLAATFACAGSALAVPCYIVYNRDNVVIYRDVVPPFDLSVQNAPERAAMRQRGAHLLFADFETCAAVGYVSPSTGASTATVEEIVMRLKPAIDTAVGTPGHYVSSGVAR